MNGSDAIPKNKTFKIIGEALLYASIVSSIGSVEMSSKFSVMNFSQDQKTLQRASDALSSFLIVALFWSIGNIFILYSKYDIQGLIWGLILNSVSILWIILSYIHAFKVAAKENGLEKPKLFVNWL
jgi:glucose uptake protein GlcU